MTLVVLATHGGHPAFSARPASSEPVDTDDGTSVPVHQGPQQIEHFTRGVVDEVLDVAVALARGDLLLDLRDDWVPSFLTDDASLGARGTVAWRETYIALANEQFAAASIPPRARADRSFELWGIPPSLSVLQRRLEDEQRHACHDALDEGDNAALATVKLPQMLGTWGRPTRRKADIARLQSSVADGDAGADVVQRLDDLLHIDGAARALVARLRCDGLLSARDARGGIGPRVLLAFATWQRREALIAAEPRLDEESRARLVRASRERDWLAVLRVVRERVADAAGLLEDGTALGAEQQVAGEYLDGRAARLARRGGVDADRGSAPPQKPPLPKTAPSSTDESLVGTTAGAPDLLSAATDAAVTALGLLDPRMVREVLRQLPRTLVALPRVPVPPWHSPSMDVKVTIDLGDVDQDGLWRPRVDVLPTLVVSITTKEGVLPLVRWPTTTGGRQRERSLNDDGSEAVLLSSKPSLVGSFSWATMLAAPAWYPPSTTPDDELLHGEGDDVTVNEEVLGPGYRSAYGLVMFPHARPAATAVATPRDTGIRTHGTGHLASVLAGGPSHGCHRLLPQHAHRLASFLLHHRVHRRDGPVRERWQRILRHGEKTWVLDKHMRGVRFSFVPPVPVEVVSGARRRSDAGEAGQQRKRKRER